MPKNILIVESDTKLSRAIRSECERLGFSVQETGDGKGTLDSIRESRPDLVVLGVELPSGYLLCGKIKKDSELKDIPIVIVGPPDGFAAHSKLKTTRANEYVATPLKMEILVERIGNLIGFPDGAGHQEGSVELGDDAIEELSPADIQLEEEATIHDPELDMLDAAFDISTSEEGLEGLEAQAEVAPPPPPVTESRLPPPPPSPSETQSLRAKVAELQLEVTEAKRKTDEAENRALTLKAQLDAKSASTGRGGKTDKEYASLRDALTKKDREILQLHTELTDKEKEILDLRDQENQLEQQHAAVSDELMQRTEQLAETQERLRRSESQSEEVRIQAEQFEAAMSQAQQESAELKGQMEAMRSELDNTRAELDERNGQLGQAQAELESAREQLSAQTETQSELEALREQLGGLQASLAQYEDETQKLHHRIGGEEKARERVKKALTIALQMLEEQSGEGDKSVDA